MKKLRGSYIKVISNTNREHICEEDKRFLKKEIQ